MSKNFPNIFILVVFTFISCQKSRTPISGNNENPEDATGYFPLKVGNTWTYKKMAGKGDSTVTVTLVGTTNINGHTFYQFDRFLSPAFPIQIGKFESWFFRRDEHNYIIEYKYGFERIHYDFNFPDSILLGQIANCHNQPGEWGAKVCQINVGLDSLTVPAGVFKNIKVFVFEIPETNYYWYEYLAPEVGPIRFDLRQSYTAIPSFLYAYDLRSAFVNNMKYP